MKNKVDFPYILKEENKDVYKHKNYRFMLKIQKKYVNFIIN